MSKIFNVTPTTFQAPLSNGDSIAVMNFIQWLRIQENNSDIKFYIPDSSISSVLRPGIGGGQYCLDLHYWLRANTDLISMEPGEYELPDNTPLWTHRTTIQDVVRLPNISPIRKKICIFPLFDAPYHVFRNWPVELANEVIQKFSTPDFDDHEKYVCIRKPQEGLILNEFSYSFDFRQNLRHIVECSHFVGGETGTSLFASALDSDVRSLNYFYSRNTYTAHNYDATPFHTKNGKGTMHYF